MTNLTEYSWYYCKMKNGDIEMHERGVDYFLSGDVPLLNNEVESVLAEVPSYEQWKMVYKTEFELLEQVVKLKELLKECRSPINYALCLNLSEEEKKEFKTLLAKINQVLGEE